MFNNANNENSAPRSTEDRETTPLCGRCEIGGLEPGKITTAFWRNAELVVVKNIPAMVCPTCGEEYVGHQTAAGLESLRNKGFPERDAVESMCVPVFEFSQETEDAAKISQRFRQI